LESEISILSVCSFPERVWGRASVPVILEGKADYHIHAWSKHQLFDPLKLELLRSGKARLGFLVDNFQDFTPGNLQRLSAWIQSLSIAVQAWKPLLFVIHNLPENSTAAIKGLPTGAEHLKIVDDPVPAAGLINPTRPSVFLGKTPPQHGVAKLCHLAGGSHSLTEEERVVLEPVERWLSTQNIPDDMSAAKPPFPVGMTVLELESLEEKTAQSLGRALLNWLSRFRTTLAPAFVQAMAGSKSQVLCFEALASSLDTPGLVDVWVDGLSDKQRASILTEARRKLPRGLNPISTSWCRRILRGQQAEADAFCNWTSQNLPAEVARTAAAVVRRDSTRLVQELSWSARLEVFTWLRQLGPSLDFPMDNPKISPVARRQPEFWRIVEAIGATPDHLSRVFGLLPAERAIFGFCSDKDWAELKQNPAICQGIQRLRNEDT
jgi:hypothetical protein